MQDLPIPGSDNVRINELGIITSGRDKVKMVDIDHYELTLLNKKVLKHKYWLVAVSIIGYIDEFDRDHLVIVHDPFSRSKRFPYIATYNKPKYYDEARTIRYVPGVPFVAVDQAGHVIDTRTGNSVCQYIGKSGYVHVFLDNGYKFPVHRLVAKAWIEGNSPSLNVVNHLNGREKSNNCVSNLEWTTYKGNSEHALRTGLCPYAHKGKIRDIYTGEITEFPSLESLNNFLGLHQKEIRHFLKRRGNIVYCGRYEVRAEGDNRPWVYEHGKAVNVEPSRYIFHVKDHGKEFTVNGVRTLIKMYKCWNMGGTSAKRTLARIAETHPDVEIECIDQYDSGPFEVRDIESNEVKTFPMIKTIVKEMNMCKTTVLDALKDPGRKVIYDRYVIRVASKEKWPEDIKMAMYRPMRVRVTDKTTKETREYNSIKEAARATGIDRVVIKRMIRSPRDFDAVEVTKVEDTSSLSSNR